MEGLTMRDREWRLAVAAWLGAMALLAAPALAELRTEKHLALGPGGRLVIESQIGNVALRGVDGAAGATVVVTANRDDLEKDYEIRFEEAPGEARVTIKRRNPSWWNALGLSHDRVEIAASVPRAAAANVHVSGGDIEVASLDGAVTVASSGGNIHAKDLAGKLDAHSSGGDVDVHDCRGDVELASSGGNVRAVAIRGRVNARSSGGEVRIERAAGDVHGSSSGGGVEILQAGGRVVAGSSGGEVKVSFAPGNAHGGEITSSGGGVEIRVDRAVSLDVEASSSGGSVDCKLPLTVQGKARYSAHRVEGKLGGGGEHLSVRASGGDVSIESL
jgi:DUF4097 and DUF4098 domain-containing protein YvlB